MMNKEEFKDEVIKHYHIYGFEKQSYLQEILAKFLDVNFDECCNASWCSCSKCTIAIESNENEPS